ncbi:MAG: hypothetical protein RLZZ200_2665 [Pseudomonadota bacterium]|jgi:glycerophosphoryl diester phosphodiesterase
MSRPIVIGHRGACGYRPEHTLESYHLAIELGADYIEPDLVMTRDGVLVARHENEIGGTTDVAAHVEFASRRRTQLIDCRPVTGWFVEDFTLAELKTLRARERLPELRVSNTAYDGRFEVPTFDEVLALLAAENAARAARGLNAIGVYPETKHPTHFRSIGLPLEDVLLAALDRGLAGAPVFIQSFELGNLVELRARCEHPLVFLVESEGAPYDFVVRGDARDYRALMQPEGLAMLAQHVNAVGVAKSLVRPVGADGRLAAPTSLVDEAHRAGLVVHAWTFRAENRFLPPALRVGADEAVAGDLKGEIRAFLDAGLDGFFTDHADVGRATLDVA